MQQLEDLSEEHPKSEYDELPASIQMIYSRKEWLWLTDSQKADAVRNECEPDTNFDD